MHNAAAPHDMRGEIGAALVAAALAVPSRNRLSAYMRPGRAGLRGRRSYDIKLYVAINEQYHVAEIFRRARS